MRLNAKIDNNQREIATALKNLGCSVLYLHTVGRGCPDLLIGTVGVNVLIEIKTMRGKLTDDQIKFADEWRGRVYVVRTVDEAIAIINAVRQEASL